MIFHLVAGSEQVVVGDLVYCQRDKSNSAVAINSERAVGNEDTNDCDNLEETLEADIPVESNDLVKVSNYRVV